MLKPSVKSPYLSARCHPRLKQRVKEALMKAGQDESEFVRVAAAEFLENHPTPKDVINAVVRSRTSGNTER